MEKPEGTELMEDDPTTPTAEETPSSATQFQSATATPQRGYRQQGEVLHAPTSRVTYQLGGCIGNYEFVTSKVPEIGMKDPRRGVFAEQPADLKRTIAKWKTMMDLTPFDPQTERELEDWFDKNTPSIIANEASPSVVIRVLRLIATEPWHEYLDACLTKVGVFKYIADLADALAGEMFPGTGELIAFEREIMSLAECPTVKAAREKYKKLFETYRSMCSRRQRTGIWHVEQATQIALQLIPERYLAAIRTGTYMGTWTPMSIFAHAMQMEQNTADLAAVRPEKVFQVGEDENMEELLPPPKKAKIAPTAKGPPCVRCAESGHLKKDCPFKLYQCFNCGKVGHIARACKQQIIRDSAGRPRLLARAKQTGIAMETRIDRTTPEQLKTVAAVAGNLIERREPAKKKAREKYAKKKFAKTGKEVVPRPTKREVLIAEATGEASSSSQVPAEQEEEESSDDLAEPQLSYTVFTVSNRPNKLLKIRAYINNTLTVVSLDSGATISVVNEDVAKECGIVKTKQQIPIMGLDQVATPYSLSTDTAVRVGQHAYATLQFAISPKKECPTLLSLGAMEELGLAVDYKKREAKVNGHAVHCFVAEKETEIPNVIQQTAYGSLQQTVEQESKTWTVEMTTTERAQAVNLLTEFADLWHQPQIGRCTTVEMEIKVEGKPKRIKARPTPIHLKGEMDRQVNDLLAAGVIRPDPDCEWVSPCHLVRKPRSDKWRLVTDYRYVNTLVQDDSYQIPAATDLIIRLTGAKTFTLIDLNWGFWNIRLKPESQPFTGFVVPEKGVYVWRVMPFGIKVSPTIFQRAVEKALRNVLDKGYVSVYIDDIVIYTETVSQHLQVLRETLQSLREGGFYINFLKCSFLRKEIYLGHIVSANTVKPDPKKVKALVDAQAPKDKKALKAFAPQRRT